MSHFNAFPPQPRVAKYELQERFAADPRPHKLSLLGGTLKDARGETPPFHCVTTALERVHQRGLPREYLDAAGYRPFIGAIERLIFGDAAGGEGRVVTAHTPGGTAALRLGADLLRTISPALRIWVSGSTWNNHVKVFESAGLEVRMYPYYRAAERLLDFDAMLAAVERIPAGEVLFLQASTHNPTCLDPTPAQWRQLAEAAVERGLLAFFDVAFFGFHTGVDADLAGLRAFAATGRDVLVGASYSKSFGLYNERVGSLSLVGADREAARNAFCHVEHLVRASYSNPPLHGAAVVAEILGDPELRSAWERELVGVRERMAGVRRRLAESLRAAGVTRDLSYLTRERGLFTRFDLSPAQVEELREQQAIHMSPSGWINVTMLADEQMERFCGLTAPLL